MTIKKKYPYEVDISLHRERYNELLAWLHGQGHKLRDTVEFGKNFCDAQGMVSQQVFFKESGPAAMFKLAWG